jgi:histidyl-tRNA synthetase
MGAQPQLSDADRYEIPVAVILGEDELANGLVAVKDLIAGKAVRENIATREEYRQAGRETQVTVPRGEMVAVIRGILEQA